MNSVTSARYRAFYRLTLWFKFEQRVPLRAYLRQRFEKSSLPSEEQLSKTHKFLEAAAKRHGLERRIVAGLAEHLASVHKLETRKNTNIKPAMRQVIEWNKGAYRHMLSQLNQSHGICL